jgi:uncharacterized membrane protein YedE/YeeE
MTRALVASWVAGMVFGAGLVVSGMTVPANIQGFLDFTGSFRPQLALVMVGAILIYAVAIRLPRAHRDAGLAASWMPHAAIDQTVILGAAIFGVGWGLGGYCPGPSVVAAGAGRVEAITFLASSIVGILCADVLRAPRTDLGDVARNARISP